MKNGTMWGILNVHEIRKKYYQYEKKLNNVGDFSSSRNPKRNSSLMKKTEQCGGLLIFMKSKRNPIQMKKTEQCGGVLIFMKSK
jgi:hypothetical protein